MFAFCACNGRAQTRPTNSQWRPSRGASSLCVWMHRCQMCQMICIAAVLPSRCCMEEAVTWTAATVGLTRHCRWEQRHSTHKHRNLTHLYANHSVVFIKCYIDTVRFLFFHKMCCVTLFPECEKVLHHKLRLFFFLTFFFHLLNCYLWLCLFKKYIE